MEQGEYGTRLQEHPSIRGLHTAISIGDLK